MTGFIGATPIAILMPQFIEVLATHIFSAKVDMLNAK